MKTVKVIASFLFMAPSTVFGLIALFVLIGSLLQAERPGYDMIGVRTSSSLYSTLEFVVFVTQIFVAFMSMCFLSKCFFSKKSNSRFDMAIAALLPVCICLNVYAMLAMGRCGGVGGDDGMLVFFVFWAMVLAYFLLAIGCSIAFHERFLIARGLSVDGSGAQAGIK